MSLFRSAEFRLAVALLALSLLIIGCSVAASNSAYFGKITPPPGQVLRYVTGSEIESLFPQIGTGQPAARVYSARYDGLGADGAGD